jgi:hypothetical protein
MEEDPRVHQVVLVEQQEEMIRHLDIGGALTSNPVQVVLAQGTVVMPVLVVTTAVVVVEDQVLGTVVQHNQERMVLRVELW